MSIARTSEEERQVQQIVRSMAASAIQAPSIHNTQPWTFTLGGDFLDVHLDTTRLVPEVDPTTRQAHVSCGAAIFNASVAAREHGYAYTVELLPVEGLLGRITLREQDPLTAEEEALVQALANRRTVRESFQDKAVPEEAVQALRHAAEKEGAWLHVVSNKDDLVTLTVLSDLAEEAELASTAYREELSQWVRISGEPYRDGVPAMGARAGRRTASPVALRSFVPQEGGLGHEAPHVEHPLIVILGTDRDTPLEWLQAGMALEHLLLVATSLGLAASPLNQPVDHAPARSMLSQILGSSLLKAQMILRIGYGETAYWSGRRPLREQIYSA